MSIKSQEGRKNKSVEKLEGWDVAIADAKNKIQGLEFSIQVFEQYKRQGRPWPGQIGYTVTQEAGTAKEAVPA